MAFELMARHNGVWEWVAGGEPTPVPPTEFQYGIEKPVAVNAGVEPGVVLGDYDGPNNLTAANTHYEGAYFPAKPSLAAANLTFKNCEFAATPSMYAVGGGGVVQATNVNVWGAQFENCTIRPAGESDASVGIVGRNFEMYRCDISGVIDGVRVHDTTNPDADSNVKLHGLYIHDLAYWTPFAGHADNQTHNDGIQVEGGKSVDIFGCNIEARADATLGTGQNTQYPPYALACIMITPTVGKVDGLRLRDNWLDGGYAPVNMSEKGRGPILGLEITGNRFSGQKGLTQDILMPMSTRIANDNGAGWTGNIRLDTMGQPVYGYGG